MTRNRESQLSRMLFLRLGENRWSKSLERTLRDSPPGGVLLAEPLDASPSAVAEFCLRLRRTSPHALFIGLREEGGTRNPLSRFFPPLPSPRQLGDSGSKATEQCATLTGEALYLLGMNLNFAPTLDLRTAEPAKPSADPTFGDDPAWVAECGGANLRGLARGKILACGKHFPGSGSVPKAAKSGLPVSGKPMAALWNEDLVPFRKLLPKLPMVLISSASYKAYDFEIPRAACLSPFVVGGLLREKLGYRGVAIGYDLEERRVHGAAGFPGAVIESVTAGCDMLLIDPGETYEAACGALQMGFDSEKLSSSRAEEALGRIKRVARGIAPPAPKLSTKNVELLRTKIERFARNLTHA